MLFPTATFAIFDVPGFRGATFYPTLDVHGSLWLVHNLRNADFPATILFGFDDFAGVEEGAFIRKAVVLERPDSAVPIPSRPDQPVELTAPAHRDLIQEATRHGAPLAVLYFGQRKFSPEEIAATTVPGTLLLPGETSIGPPRLPPILPWGCHPVHDPRSGPPHDVHAAVGHADLAAAPAALVPGLAQQVAGGQAAAAFDVLCRGGVLLHEAARRIGDGDGCVSRRRPKGDRPSGCSARHSGLSR